MYLVNKFAMGLLLTYLQGSVVSDISFVNLGNAIQMSGISSVGARKYQIYLIHFGCSLTLQTNLFKVIHMQLIWLSCLEMNEMVEHSMYIAILTFTMVPCSQLHGSSLIKCRFFALFNKYCASRTASNLAMDKFQWRVYCNHVKDKSTVYAIDINLSIVRCLRIRKEHWF